MKFNDAIDRYLIEDPERFANYVNVYGSNKFIQRATAMYFKTNRPALFGDADVTVFAQRELFSKEEELFIFLEEV